MVYDFYFVIVIIFFSIVIDMFFFITILSVASLGEYSEPVRNFKMELSAKTNDH